MIQTLGQKNVKHVLSLDCSNCGLWNCAKCHKEVKRKSISQKNGEKPKESMPCAMTRNHFLIKFVASSSVITASFEVGKIILDMVNYSGITHL
jgi:uncharacterized CHY-type Zn-finger protein